MSKRVLPRELFTDAEEAHILDVAEEVKGAPGTSGDYTEGFVAGSCAGLEGEPETANPYARATDLRRHVGWREGWRRVQG